MKTIRSFLCAAFTAMGLVLVAASPVFAQSSPSPEATGKPPFLVGGWSKYMALVLVVAGVGVLALTALGYLIQSPGFRRQSEGSGE